MPPAAEGDLGVIEEVEQAETAETGTAADVVVRDAAVEAGDEAEIQHGPNDIPAVDTVPGDIAASSEAGKVENSEPLVDNQPIPASLEDAQPVSADAESLPVPEVVVETNVEAPTTAAEEAPITTEPPKGDVLSVLAEQATETEQTIEQSAAPAEVDPSCSVQDTVEAVPAATASSDVAPPAPDTDDPAPPSTDGPAPPSTDDLAPSTETEAAVPAVEVTPASAEETAVAIAQSAENAASAYKSRTRRRSSVSSTDSRETLNAFQPEVTPSMNRLSILYEGSQRRMCFDAEVVERIEVHRGEGRLEVIFVPFATKNEGEEENGNGMLPKGYLVCLSHSCRGGGS